MQRVNNYILLVERQKDSVSKKNLRERYRVAANTEKEAIELLRKKIKEGTIRIYYKCDPELEMKKDILSYKKVAKETFLGNGKYEQIVI